MREELHANDITDEKDDASSSSSSPSEDEFEFIESEWENGVETGLVIQWPESKRALNLSTKLSEDLIAPLFDGTQWAGTRVWKAAVVALEYLLEEYPPGMGTKKSLLELGCGLGVPAMLWHLLQEEEVSVGEDDSTPSEQSPQRVVLTDMPDLLPQLEANVRRNFDGSYYGSSIEAKALSWSKQGIRDLLDSENAAFDICLNCDCIYEPLYGRDSWEALADLLAEVAQTSPSTLLVTSVERRKGDGLELFIERLEATGTVQPLRRVLRNDEDSHHVIEIYISQGIAGSSSGTLS